MAGDEEELDFFQPRRPQAPRLSRDRSPRTFDAAYSGECNVCGAEFDEGDPIAYLDNEIVDEDCWAEAGE